MISRLWLALTRSCNYKTDINVKYHHDSSKSTTDDFVVVVHRSYRVRGGEDLFLSDVLIPSLLSLNISFEVIGLPALFSNPNYKILDLAEALFMILGLERSRPSYYVVIEKIKKKVPTQVIFNNVIPTVSLALPQDLRHRGIKTMMWVHNARIQCANGLNFNGREECHRCLTKGSRWAALQKCFSTLGQALIYSFIYRNHRVSKIIAAGVDRFISVSEFTAENIQNTFGTLNLAARPVTVIPHPVAPAQPHSTVRADLPTKALIAQIKKIPSPFYAFIGRLSFEKGADRVLELARKFPKKGFLICGEGPLIEKLRDEAPANVAFAGYVEKEEKVWIFKNAAALLIASRVPETSSLIISESQAFGTPVVYPTGGGAEETFKLLRRTGCPWDEFTGQEFKRTDPPAIDDTARFDSELQKILSF